MKINSEIRKQAEAAAWAHFYSDVDLPWEPFENYSDDWIDEQRERLADSIVAAMVWAQNQK
jgi:hypothetical protein